MTGLMIMAGMRTISVTIDEPLYRRLKRTAGPRGMSRFIAEAVLEKLDASREDLYREYQMAAQDPGRREILADWHALETESWP